MLYPSLPHLGCLPVQDLVQGQNCTGKYLYPGTKFSIYRGLERILINRSCTKFSTGDVRPFSFVGFIGKPMIRLTFDNFRIFF
eukprot:SAG31_NODE_10_length_40133_cov_27.863041_21_plen_83_part_00